MLKEEKRRVLRSSYKQLERHQWKRFHVLEYLISERTGDQSLLELGVRQGKCPLHLLKWCSPGGKSYSPLTQYVGIDSYDDPENEATRGVKDPERYVRRMKREAEEICNSRPGYRLIIGRTDDVAESIKTKFDIVWIDADHSYEAVTTDIKNYLSKVKKEGIICGHDYDFKGVKKAVHEHFDTVETWPDDVWVVRL